jgi:hypothetical protein
VGVFLARVAGGDGVKIRLCPKCGGERREADAGVELLGGLDHELGATTLEVRGEVGAVGETVPLLRPAVVDPVGGNELGDGLVVFLGELVLSLRVELKVERAEDAHEVVV